MLSSQRPVGRAATNALAVSKPEAYSSQNTAYSSQNTGSKEVQARRRDAMAEAATDRLLVQRFNGGDGAAFDDIVERYREKLQALAARFLRNNADAEEIAQDTLIRAYRGLARFRGESSLATWLHRIAVNLARNRYWHSFRRRKHLGFT